MLDFFIRIPYYYILILVCITSCATQKIPENVPAKAIISEIMFTDDVILIHKMHAMAEEIDEKGFKMYKNLEKNKYVKLVLIDSSRNNKSYKVELLPKSEIFIKGRVSTSSKSVLLKTVAHDTIEINSVTSIDDYYKINYKVISPKRTPFHEDYYIKSLKPLQTYKDSCFAKYLNDNWQVIRNTAFYDYKKYSSPFNQNENYEKKNKGN